MAKQQITKDYKVFFTEIKEKIYKAQYEAMKEVNTALIKLYWDIGKGIVEKQQKYKWGKSVVETLANDLQKEFAGVNGLSSRNLWLMRKFYQEYTKDTKLQPLVAEIGWSHNIIIIEKCKNLLQREFYIKMAIKYRWTKNVLIHHIEGKSYEKFSPPEVGVLTDRNVERKSFCWCYRNDIFDARNHSPINFIIIQPVNMNPKDFQYKGHRNSYTELNEVYFWTITINKWQHLLKTDENKMIVINSLQWLVKKELVKIYGYVIMPNHIHLLWEQLAMNGKEFPKNSFEKFTAKTLVNKMKAANDTALINFAVTASDREYSIWLRDPLAIKIFSREIAAQKLEYMHLNPLQPHWALCKHPAEYRFSSAMFYEQGVDEFGLLTHFREVWRLGMVGEDTDLGSNFF